MHGKSVMAEKVWNFPPAKRCNYIIMQEQHIRTVRFEFDGKILELFNAEKFIALYCASFVDRPMKIFPWIAKEAIEDHKKSSVVFIAETKLPTLYGEFKVRAYRDLKAKFLEPIAIISGNVHGKQNVSVRVHDQCFTSEVLGNE